MDPMGNGIIISHEWIRVLLDPDWVASNRAVSRAAASPAAWAASGPSWVTEVWLFHCETPGVFLGFLDDRKIEILPVCSVRFDCYLPVQYIFLGFASVCISLYKGF